jgi:hypothetical protein
VCSLNIKKNPACRILRLRRALWNIILSAAVRIPAEHFIEQEIQKIFYPIKKSAKADLNVCIKSLIVRLLAQIGTFPIGGCRSFTEP